MTKMKKQCCRNKKSSKLIMFVCTALRHTQVVVSMQEGKATTAVVTFVWVGPVIAVMEEWEAVPGTWCARLVVISTC